MKKSWTRSTQWSASKFSKWSRLRRRSTGGVTIKPAIAYSTTIAAETRLVLVGMVVKVAGIHKGSVRTANTTRTTSSLRRE